MRMMNHDILSALGVARSPSANRDAGADVSARRPGDFGYGVAARFILSRKKEL